MIRKYVYEERLSEEIKKIKPIEFYTESEEVTATTVRPPDWTNKLTLTVTPPISGEYMLSWFAEVGNSVAERMVEVRVRNYTAGVNYLEARIYCTPRWIDRGRNLVSGIKKVSLDTTPVSFGIDFNAVTHTGFIRFARLSLRRVIPV